MLDPFDKSATTEEKIRDFLTFPKGWHAGEGHGPNQETVDKALTVLSEMRKAGFCKTDAFPGVWGEIEVDAYLGVHCLDFIVEVNGTITSAYEVGKEDVEYEERIPFENAIKLLNEWAKRIFSSSESSRAAIGDQRAIGSPV